MLIAELNEEVKKMFLDLCIYAAKSDDFFAEDEKFVVKTYALEMGIDEVWYEPRKELGEILEKVERDCSDREKKIILLELLSLVMVDDDFSEKEQTFISNVSGSLHISDAKKNEMISILDEVKEVTKKLYDVVD